MNEMKLAHPHIEIHGQSMRREPSSFSDAEDISPSSILNEKEKGFNEEPTFKNLEAIIEEEGHISSYEDDFESMDQEITQMMIIPTEFSDALNFNQHLSMHEETDNINSRIEMNENTKTESDNHDTPISIPPQIVKKIDLQKNYQSLSIKPSKKDVKIVTNALPTKRSSLASARISSVSSVKSQKSIPDIKETTLNRLFNADAKKKKEPIIYVPLTTQKRISRAATPRTDFVKQPSQSESQNYRQSITKTIKPKSDYVDQPIQWEKQNDKQQTYSENDFNTLKTIPLINSGEQYNDAHNESPQINCETTNIDILCASSDSSDQERRINKSRESHESPRNRPRLSTLSIQQSNDSISESSISSRTTHESTIETNSQRSTMQPSLTRPKDATALRVDRILDLLKVDEEVTQTIAPATAPFVEQSI